MVCIKCKKDIAQESVYCSWCGKKQTKDNNKPKTLKRANGQGSVYKLSGRRSRPWVASKNKMVLGYFATKIEASNYLNNAVINPISDKFNYTIETLYNEWSAQHYTTLSKSASDGLRSAWLYLKPLYNLKAKDLKTEHYQVAIDNAVNQKKSRAVCEKIKQLCSHLCKYAMQYDLINKNYSAFLKLPKQENKEKEVFTENQINLLFENDSDETIKIILILIYTGLRINELFKLEKSKIDVEKRMFVAGSKTEAGIDRSIPIHDKIIDYIKYFIKTSESNYLLCNEVGKKKDIKNFRERDFTPTLKKLGIENITPHATRRTFASRAAKAGMKPEVLKRILGHAQFSTTAEFYIFPDAEEFLDNINLM